MTEEEYKKRAEEYDKQMQVLQYLPIVIYGGGLLLVGVLFLVEYLIKLLF